ncbi:unnamed protein product [Brugia timori]|uniref:Uncharacterized protein n=1 Tax=Brugia timori TaxID=42155 RepID=A0A0R3R3S6_9BILA|nr:unnamed protein product [Brugia timori]
MSCLCRYQSYACWKDTIVCVFWMVVSRKSALCTISFACLLENRIKYEIFDMVKNNDD